MKFDDVKKLHQKKYRTQFRHYLVEGEHLILELEKAYKNRQEGEKITLYITEQQRQFAERRNADFQQVVLSEKQMNQLSDTKSPQGIMACVPMPKESIGRSTAKTTERCIYLHEVQDPGNLGTIMRNLAWFGNFRLLLSPNSVDPYNSKVVRSSMGAIFHLPIELDALLDDLPNRFKNFAYLGLHGATINHPDFADYDCYLFGNEARGIPPLDPQRFNSKAFTINGTGVIDSLNLANAVGICAYRLSL